MTIATVVSQAAIVLNQSVVTSSVINSADRIVNELVTHAQIAGDEIARRHDWGGLVTTTAFTISDAVAVSGLIAIPSDFDRFIEGGAVILNGEVICGALSDSEMNLKRSAPTTSPKRYIRVGSNIEIAPRPTAGQTGSITYLSQNWVATAGGRTGSWVANADSTVFPERLILKAILYRHRRQMGLSYQDEMNEFEADLAMSIISDRGVRLPGVQLPSVNNPQ